MCCYSSASVAAHQAFTFLRRGGTLEMLLVAGRPVFFMSAFAEEMEYLVPPREYLVRSALPVDVLRLLGIEGTVLVLEDAERAARVGRLATMLLVQRKLAFLFGTVVDTLVQPMATADVSNTGERYPLVERLMAPTGGAQDVGVDVVQSVGGTGKTTVLLALCHQLLSSGCDALFISLPALQRHLERRSAPPRLPARARWRSRR